MNEIKSNPAKRKIGTSDVGQEEKPKLRVAAYCRVSTDSDEQAASYEAQVEHHTEYIQNNPDLTLAGVFAEEYFTELFRSPAGTVVLPW